jgi:predicted RNA-binding protein with PUA-like domain
VSSASYPDPTSDDPRWVVVDLVPVRPLLEPVTLAQIEVDAALREIPLVKQSRLSVMPLERPAFDRILVLGKTRLRRPRKR